MAGAAQHAGLASEPGDVMGSSLNVSPGTEPVSPRSLAAGPLAGAALAALLAASLPGWSGIATLAWLLAVVIIRRVPVTGVIALIALVPLDQRGHIQTIAGAITLPTLVGLAIVAGLGLSITAERRFVIDRVAIAHALVIVTLVASYGAGGVRLRSWWLAVAMWLLPLAVYIVCRSWEPTRQERALVVAAISVSVLVFGVAGFWQYATGAGPKAFTVGGEVRVFGPFDHPNTFAAWLVLSLPVLAAVSVLLPGTWLARAGFVVGAVVLILTQSRGGMLALTAAMVVMLLLAPRRIQRLTAIAGVAAVALGLAAGMLTTLPGADRFVAVAVGGDAPVQVTTETWGQLERQAHWGAAWSMLQSNPFFGVGGAEFSDNYREHTPEWRFRVSRGSAHNAYLHLGAEAGVPGLIAVTLWVGTMLVALGRRCLRSAGPGFVLALGAFGATAAYAVDSFVEYLDIPSLPILLAVLVAVGLSGRDTAAVPMRMTGAAL